MSVLCYKNDGSQTNSLNQ